MVLFFEILIILTLICFSITKLDWSIIAFVFIVFIVNGLVFDRFELLPVPYRWTTYILSFLILISALLRKGSSANFLGNPLFWPLFLWIIWAFFTGFVGEVTPPTILLLLKNYLIYVFLCFALALTRLNEVKLKRMIYVFFGVVLVQVPIVALQYSSELRWGNPDFICGTLGMWGTGQLMILSVMVIGFLFSFSLIYAYSKKFILISILVTLSSIYESIAGAAQAIIVYLPATLLFLLLTIGRKKRRRFKIFAQSLFGITVAIFLLMTLHKPFELEVESFLSRSILDLTKTTFSPSVGGERTIDANNPGRLFSLRYNINRLLSEGIRTLLIGKGFGSTKISYFSGLSGSSTERIFHISQVAGSLYETGFIGLVLYLFIIVQALKMNRVFSEKIRDPFWKSISLGYNGVIFLHFAGAFYHGIWYSTYSSFPFWFFSGIVFTIGARKGFWRRQTVELRGTFTLGSVLREINKVDP